MYIVTLPDQIVGLIGQTSYAKHQSDSSMIGNSIHFVYFPQMLCPTYEIKSVHTVLLQAGQLDDKYIVFIIPGLTMGVE